MCWLTFSHLSFSILFGFHNLWSGCITTRYSVAPAKRLTSIYQNSYMRYWAWCFRARWPSTNGVRLVFPRNLVGSYKSDSSRTTSEWISFAVKKNSTFDEKLLSFLINHLLKYYHRTNYVEPLISIETEVSWLTPFKSEKEY